MNQTAAQAGLVSGKPRLDGAEFRREVRFPMRRGIEILPCNTSGFIGAELIDCSVHGIALLLDRALPDEQRSNG